MAQAGEGLLEVNGERLLARLDQFAAIGATSKGGVNRQALTARDRQARQLLADLGRARGFSVYQDPIANLFLRREGQNPDLPPLLIGSHLDSQPSGGRFDGALGTLCAFEVLETLEDHGIETERAVEVVAFTNEEGCRFSPGCMGSMAFSQGAIPATWPMARATDGALFSDDLAATLADLQGADMRPLGFPVFAYLEVHIEQGPSLEKEGLPIGIVTGIQGTRWLQVTISGQTAHAGTTALSYRKDPMRAAVSGLNVLYNDIMPQDAQSRLTVGRFSLEPGAINAIPAAVTFSLDIRHPNFEQLDLIEAKIRKVLQDHAGENGCDLEIELLFDMAPARFTDHLVTILESAAIDAGFAHKSMVSGAFHDALFINRVAPSAMIFTPCRNGLSHNEEEYVKPADSVAGAQVLLTASLQLLSNLTTQASVVVAHLR
ncbi:Zn-dependent hydrolase [Agrobacterium vitis]|uniref:Hydantoinase/carbamoylase family amidase n=1 Tax=Agrobacterium vitis TaxID=373 RepID=A0AAE4WD31_AGRVI|nr:Zn-dependent hydrolase [Agrobacterium vitis]MCF1500048.1 Zn-dependent hydrolase [Allorhizobium sp. Av2]MUZ58677.1 hydantoinase/carbamoylase family amidase [Agrobacterium vitis]MVA66312.1 hydantoinase/carbamoylase family amidase [Agrobacterium vitis]MVA88349.1 hydantoinase/carbamoylase family amidase [Agrobacterium vitis]